MLITLPLLFLILAEENFDLDLREDEDEQFAAAAAAVESKCCFNLVDFCFTLLPRYDRTWKGAGTKGTSEYLTGDVEQMFLL